MALSTVQGCLSQLKCLWYSGSSQPLDDLETYDRASRGLWGIVQLLWKLRLTPTASFGALLTVAHLAVVPLTQQSLLSLSMPLVAHDGEAAIPASKDWTEASQQTQSLEMPSGLEFISAEMKGAILNGIYTSTNIKINNTLPTCTTGNCTFPTYQSLAICASNADVTLHLQNATTKGVIKWCLSGGFCASINLTTNSAFPLMTMATITSQDTSPLNYTSLTFATRPSPIANFYIIYYNFTQSGPTTAQPWAAVEFALDWCVPTFSTSVTNGTATTSRLPDPFIAFNATPGYLISVRLAGEDITVDPNTHATLQRYLNLTLSGSAYRSEVYSYMDSDTVQKLNDVFEIGGQGTDLNPLRADGIAALEDMLMNTATSMTNYMRSTCKVDVMSGIAYMQQNVVHVRWG